MQSEHAIPSADLGLLGTFDSARHHLTADAAMIASDSPDADDRWRMWCARGATADRKSARMMNGGFVAIFVALSAWLVLQLLS